MKTGTRHEATGNSKRFNVFGFTLWALLFVLYSFVSAQKSAKIPRIGFVSGAGDTTPNIEAFRQGLRELGYSEGKNILVEYRLSGDLAAHVDELVQLKVDMLVVVSFRAIKAAQQATKTIPIVMVTTQDPVETGFVERLARPGGNITGNTTLARDLSGKRLELLKEVAPEISRVGVLRDTDTSGTAFALKEYEAAAARLKIPLQSLEVRGPNPDIEKAFRAGSQGRMNAVMTIRNSLLNRYRKQITELANKYRLASMYEASAFTNAGGLMSYAADDAENYRRAAIYVDKILKGAKPAELPVEQPTKFELVINLKTAKQIGLTIPPHVLARADKVIR